MKLIIDIPKKTYNEISESTTIKCGEVFSQKLLKYIKNGIPLDEQGPKTGHWIGDNRGFYIYAKCSECGSVHDTATNYCPNCGCLMDRIEFDEYVKKEGDL